MSNIVVVLSKKTIDVSVLKELHKILGGSLARIRTAITKGLPVLETEIFDNQYDEKAALLRKIIDLIRRSRIDVEFYELPEGDTFKKSSVLKDSLIDGGILENILNSSDDEM